MHNISSYVFVSYRKEREGMKKQRSDNEETSRERETKEPAKCVTGDRTGLYIPHLLLRFHLLTKDERKGERRVDNDEARRERERLAKGCVMED